GDELDLREVLAALGARGIASVLVEAGPMLAASVIRAALFDEIAIFQAPIVLGGDARPAIGALGRTSLDALGRLDVYRLERVDDSGDIEIRLRPARKQAGTE